MHRAERETVVIFNRQDAEEGFFTVSSTIKGHVNKLRRLALRKHFEDKEGGVYELPIALLAPSMGIRARKRVGKKRESETTTGST